MGLHKYNERYQIGHHIFKKNTIRYLEVCSSCGKSRVIDEKIEKKIIFNSNRKRTEVISTRYSLVK